MVRSEIGNQNGNGCIMVARFQSLPTAMLIRGQEWAIWQSFAVSRDTWAILSLNPFFECSKKLESKNHLSQKIKPTSYP